MSLKWGILLGVILLGLSGFAAEQELLTIKPEAGSPVEFLKMFKEAKLFLLVDDQQNITGARISCEGKRLKHPEMNLAELLKGYTFASWGVEILSLKIEKLSGSNGYRLKIRYLKEYKWSDEDKKYQETAAELVRNEDGHWSLRSMDPKRPGPFKTMALSPTMVKGKVRGIAGYELSSLDPNEVIAVLEPAKWADEDSRISTRMKKTGLICEGCEKVAQDIPDSSAKGAL